MGTITGFWGEAKPRPTSSMKFAIWVFTQWIATLYEKTRLHTMEGRSIEELNFCQFDEIFDMSWRSVREEPKLDLTKLRRDRRFRIFLFELELCWTRHSDGECTKGKERTATLRSKMFRIVAVQSVEA